MLVLSRKQGQEIVIGENIKITILKSRGNTIRLGIEAPRDVKVVRGELESQIEQIEPNRDAEFTVVFAQDTDVDTNVAQTQNASSSDQVGVVQFDTNRNSRGGLQSTSPMGNRSTLEEKSETVQFRGQLPKVLHHNRLKDIVNRIAIDKTSPTSID